MRRKARSYEPAPARRCTGRAGRLLIDCHSVRSRPAECSKGYPRSQPCIREPRSKRSPGDESPSSQRSNSPLLLCFPAEAAFNRPRPTCLISSIPGFFCSRVIAVFPCTQSARASSPSAFISARPYSFRSQSGRHSVFRPSFLNPHSGLRSSAL